MGTASVCVEDRCPLADALGKLNRICPNAVHKVG